MDGLLYASVPRLEDHAHRVRQLKYLAQELSEQLRRDGYLVTPEEESAYWDAQRRAEHLVLYFDGLSKTVDNMGAELALLSRRIAQILEESTYQS